MTLGESCSYFSRILGREVVPARNIYVINRDEAPAEFYKNVAKYDSASFFNHKDGKVYVYFGHVDDNMMGRVEDKVIFAMVSAFGPRALLRDDKTMARFMEETGATSEEAALAGVLSCSRYTPEDKRTMSVALRLAGYSDVEASCVAAISGMRAYYGQTRQAAINEGDMDTLSLFAEAALYDETPDASICFGLPTQTWLEMGFPSLNISVRKEAFVDMVADSGFAKDEIRKLNLVAHVNDPIAFLKEKNGDLRAILPVRDAKGDFLTFGIHAPAEGKDFEKYSHIGLKGFGAIHPEALVKRLALRNEKNETIIAALRKKPESLYSYVMMDVLRDIEREFRQKTNPGERRVEANDATSGVLKLDANIRTIPESTKFSERFLQKKEKDSSKPKYQRQPLSSEEFDRLMEKAKENVGKHKNDHLFKDVDEAISKAIQEAETVQEVETKDPMKLPLSADHFSPSERMRLASAGIVDAASLRNSMLAIRRKGFVETFGAKAWASSLSFMESLGQMTPAMVRPRPLDVANVKDDFDAVRLENLRESLNALPGDLAQGVLIMPRGADGTVMQGSDTHYMVARMATTPQWQGCPVFIPASKMETYGLSPIPDAEPVLSKKEGEAMYNLMDTDMNGILKEEVLAASKARPRAVPASLLTQTLSVRQMTADIAPQTTDYLDRTWKNMSSFKDDAVIGPSLEDLLLTARQKVEKRLDPKDSLRKYGFPEGTLSEVMEKGDIKFTGNILVRPSDGISRDETRKVSVRLRLLDGTIRICTPGGHPVGESLAGALKSAKLDDASLSRLDRFFIQNKQNDIQQKGLKQK